MSKKTQYLLGILLTLILGTYFYWTLCCSQCSSATNTTEIVQEAEAESQESTTVSAPTPTPVATRNAFAITDANGAFSFTSTDNFNFETSGFTPLSPIASEIDAGIAKLQTYLSENKNKSVAITGLFTSSETNTSAFPNLGIARANAVKNYMVSKGLSSKQLNTFGKLSDELIPEGTIYNGPLEYTIATADEATAEASEEELKALKAKIKANPLVLYFAFGENSIDLSEAQRQKIADIATYLDKVDDASVSVIGHTDNVGSGSANLQMGQERANFVKDYLVTNGIPETKVKAGSRGPDQPIASNNTEAGRAKNRRTVISLK